MLLSFTKNLNFSSRKSFIRPTMNNKMKLLAKHVFIIFEK